MKKPGVSYSPHYFSHAEGHIYLGWDKQGACTIMLTGAASMTQAELDRFGEVFAEAAAKYLGGTND